MYLISGKKDECVGCSACKNICPVNAIEMHEDEEGFLYPKINYNICINCKACEKVCPLIKKSSNNEVIKLFGVKHKDDNVRFSSRSGGVFVALSDCILRENGVVYGARLNDDFSVSHDRAENEEERNRFKGSKYIQSDMRDSLKSIKTDLKNDKYVLFSGTSCQVGAVNSFIPNNMKDKLFTIDILCHGVPSPKIFKDYLKYIEAKFNKKIVAFNFRDKLLGWNTHYETILFEDNSKETSDIFRNIFYKHVALRPACHYCNYANLNRAGDITIADFWGIEENSKEFNDNKGVSLVLINSLKGIELMDKIVNEVDVILADIEIAKQYNPNLERPSERSIDRENFWEDYHKEGFKFVKNKYGKR